MSPSLTIPESGLRYEEWDGDPAYTSQGAIFGSDDAYRYRLYRYWLEDWSKGPLVFLMLNPSTADAKKLDPTVRRCVARARRMGYDGCEVVNVFAYRATNPQDMVDWEQAGQDIEGPCNRTAILEVCRDCDVIVAHGAHKRIPPQMRRWAESGFADKVTKAARNIWALRITKSGWPEHPLYLPDALEPKPYNWGRME